MFGNMKILNPHGSDPTTPLGQSREASFCDPFRPLQTIQNIGGALHSPAPASAFELMFVSKIVNNDD
jgi:hypothetical protein